MQHLCVANIQEGNVYNWLNTNANTQEGAASYAMCIHWLDMASPQPARPTIGMAVPDQFHPPN